MKETKKSNNQKPIIVDPVGLDQDEQEMNGDYGMPETDYEDQLHEKKE